MLNVWLFVNMYSVLIAVVVCVWLQMLDVRMVDDETPVKFNKNVVFSVDKYEIV